MKLPTPKRPTPGRQAPRDMTRDECVRIIEALYPADSQKPIVAQAGRELYQRASEACDDWRLRSLCVLRKYAQLCVEKSDREIDHLRRRGEVRE